MTSSADDADLIADDTDEPEVAAAAGLRYVLDSDDGWSRRRCGRGFTYVDERGRTLRGEARTRAEDLVIPPAWTEVWICPHEDSHLLATGRDDAGRKQYLYHPRWREVRDQQKFARLGRFGDRLIRVRQRVQRDLEKDEPTLERAAAAAVRMMDRALVRVGNDVYAEDQETFGATTLERRHIEVVGADVHLRYTGKGDVERRHHLEDDPALVGAVRDCLELGGTQALCGQGGDGVVDLTSDHVNAYVQRIAGAACTAKDFRTFGGTVAATDFLGELGRHAEDDDLRDAVDAAAEVLGNTRAVARSSYVSPRVLSAAESGELVDVWASSRSGPWMSRAERTCRKLLDR